jgi:bifunctional non-homologous end joining protein LigD
MPALVRSGPLRRGIGWRDELRNNIAGGAPCRIVEGCPVTVGPCCRVLTGESDFNGLHSRRHDAEVEFYAFDMLASDGEDLRKLPLTMRKTKLARLLARRVDGIHLAPFEQGEIGPGLFRHACLMGLEGLVSKHRDSFYRAGRSDRWIKVKNQAHPDYRRVQEQF